MASTKRNKRIIKQWIYEQCSKRPMNLYDLYENYIKSYIDINLYIDIYISASKNSFPSDERLGEIQKIINELCSRNLLIAEHDQWGDVVYRASTPKEIAERSKIKVNG